MESEDEIMMTRLTDYEFNTLMNNAKHQNDPDAMIKIFALMEKQKAMEATEAVMYPPPQLQPTPPPKLSLEMDDYYPRKNVTINVQIMVENLLGGSDPNRDVQVCLEKYGAKLHSDLVADHLSFVVVNICNLRTGHIITLRETYGKFPSPEFLTKLELLRSGDVAV